MQIPVWVLLAFAMWTLVILATTVGVYRWIGILTRRLRFDDFAEVRIEGNPWYRRAMRAHANCVENLPVYGALVVVLLVTGLRGTAFDVLALILIGARVLHSLVHVAFEQTNGIVACRSALFMTQWGCMVAFGVLIALRA